jgi:hypothetical protein
MLLALGFSCFYLKAQDGQLDICMPHHITCLSIRMQHMPCYTPVNLLTSRQTLVCVTRC